MVSEVYTQQGRWQITGSGYGLEGKLLARDQLAEQATTAHQLQPLTGFSTRWCIVVTMLILASCRARDGSKGDSPEINW